MQLTTIDQLKAVKPDTHLFLINPYGHGDQTKVSFSILRVTEVNKDSFVGSIVFIRDDINLPVDSNNYFIDLLSGCKYVFTTIDEVMNTLTRVRGGLHETEVKGHYDMCNADFFEGDT